MSNLRTLRARKDVRLTGAGNPTVATVASVTDTYQNTTSGELFTCTESVDYGWGFVQDWAGSQGTIIDADILNTANANLVAGYTMDDISGATLNDMSTNNNDGTITGANAVAGHINNALDFDGLDHVAIDPLIIPTAGTTGAVSFWVEPSTTGTSRLIGCSNDTTDVDFWAASSADRKIGMNPTSDDYLETTETLTASVFNHVVIQSTGTATEIYINGAQATVNIVVGVDNGDWWNDVTGANKATLCSIFRNSGQLSILQPAKMDQFRLFNRVLTQDEITALYNEGSL